MENFRTEKFLLASVSIYRPVLKDHAVTLLARLLEDTFENPYEAAGLYGELVQLLAESPAKGSLPDYIYEKILSCDNVYTRESAKGRMDELPAFITTAAKRDLDALFGLASIPAQRLITHLSEIYPRYASLFQGLPEYISSFEQYSPAKGWGFGYRNIAQYAAENGYGIFAQHHSFSLGTTGAGQIVLEPIRHPDGIRLSDLKGYERQRQIILDNTLSLLSGAKASHILLYGDRGTGKSSTVKAVLNEYAPKGLRLIEISKQNMQYLGALAEQLWDNPHKFIIFLDDLTFQEDDGSYNSMKAVLEGSVMKLPDNMVIYATTNRRHLMKETFSAREGDEVHLADTRSEAASLSDRFGITVTFLSPNRNTFQDIVIHLAADQHLDLDEEILLQQANIWAVRKSSFSPRCAKQFIDHVYSRVSRGLPYEWGASVH